MNNGIFFFSKQPGKPTKLVKKRKAQRPTTPTHPQGDLGGTPQPALIPHVPRFTPHIRCATLPARYLGSSPWSARVPVRRHNREMVRMRRETVRMRSGEKLLLYSRLPDFLINKISTLKGGSANQSLLDILILIRNDQPITSQDHSLMLIKIKFRLKSPRQKKKKKKKKIQ